MYIYRRQLVWRKTSNTHKPDSPSHWRQTELQLSSWIESGSGAGPKEVEPGMRHQDIYMESFTVVAVYMYSL